MVSETRQVAEVVNSLNRKLQMPVSEAIGHVKEGVSSAMGASRRAIRLMGQSVASTRAGQTIAKAAQTPAAQVLGKTMRGTTRVAGKLMLPLMVADGNMISKLLDGDVLGVGEDIVEGAWDLGKAVVSDGKEREELRKLWSEVKKDPGVLAEFLWGGVQMTEQSLLTTVLPDIGDMKRRMGHIKKPVTDKNGKPVIEDGKVQTRDVFYMAMQDKKHPSQFYFFERTGAENTLAATFNIDKKGRILSEYNVYSNENMQRRTTTEYDSTSVTNLQNRYGVDWGDFYRVNGVRVVGSTIGKPKKIVIETVLDENSPQWNEKDMKLVVDKDTNDIKLVCTRDFYSKQTEYPLYYKDGTKIASDVVIEKATQTRTYFLTKEELFDLDETTESNPEQGKKDLAELLAKKDKEKQEHPDDTRICYDEFGENKVTYGRQFYKGNPDLKNVKMPNNGEFFNQYGCVLARTESYTDKTLERGEEENDNDAEPLDSQNASIGHGAQLAHDNSGRVIRGVLDYQHHQIKQEGVSADSAYDYMGEKAVFVHRKNENGQTEVAQMIRVNPNTGVIKEFDADGVFVDVHVPHSEKHDTLALTIQSAVKVPGFDEKAAKDRLAAARKQKEEDIPTEKYEPEAFEEMVSTQQEKKDENTSSNLLTALKGCATEHREENSSLDLTDNHTMEAQR